MLYICRAVLKRLLYFFMICIYKITNPKGKVYIGQTTDYEKRLKYYKSNTSTKTQVKIYNSIQKYGFDNHIFEVIEICELNQLNEKERYWQDFYNVIGINGLNLRLTKSNDKSGYLSKETRNKISNYQKEHPENHKRLAKYANNWVGRKHKEETKKKMSESAKGKKKTAEHISKLPQNQKGYPRKSASNETKLKMIESSKSAKKINKYSLDGEFIEQYRSGNQISVKMGLYSSSNIRACANGKLKTAHGFIWKWA